MSIRLMMGSGTYGGSADAYFLSDLSANLMRIQFGKLVCAC